MRRTQPITKKAKISSTTCVHCYNGYMVNNNQDSVHSIGSPDVPAEADTPRQLLSRCRLSQPQVRGQSGREAYAEVSVAS